MGTWNRGLCGMRLIFAGSGSDQTGSADMFSDLSEKMKQHVTCRLQRAFQARRATRPEREVLMEIA